MDNGHVGKTRPRIAWSLAEVAEAAGISERQILRLRAHGGLKAKPIGGRVVVLNADLEALWPRCRKPDPCRTVGPAR